MDIYIGFWFFICLVGSFFVAKNIDLFTNDNTISSNLGIHLALMIWLDLDLQFYLAICQFSY